MCRFAVIEAPSILGLKPTGVEELPDALLRQGLARRLSARHAGRVEPQAYTTHRDPQTRMLNPRAIADYSARLADTVGQVVGAGQFPIVLGGDCSVLLGSMLALNRRGRYGLLFLDGHTDFYQPEANVNGEVASSELAFATGRGPAILTSYDGRCPLVADADVVAFGFRDQEEAESYGSQPLPQEMKAFSLLEVRRLGAETAAGQAVSYLADQKLGGFWIHLDADVLDDAVMPAVDYRLADGLSWIETEAVLQIALKSGMAVGLELTILNPKLDKDGHTGRFYVDMLCRALAP
jgi:arginase